MKKYNLYKVAIEGFALAGCMVLIFACLSFNIGDSPSRYVYPHNHPAANWCGSIGAFCAYYLLYYTGPGVFAILLPVMWLFIINLAGRSATQPILRTVGAILLATTASVTVYLFRPTGGGGFPISNGGVLGVATGAALVKHLALLGTGIIVVNTWIVGSVLLADTFVLWLCRTFGFCLVKFIGFIVPAWAEARKKSQGLADIWQRLSLRQKQLGEQRIQENIPKIESSIEERMEDILSGAPPEPKPMKINIPKPAKPLKQSQPKDYDDYSLPPIELLAEPEQGFSVVQEKFVTAQAKTLEKLLSEFSVNAQVVNAEPGPVITMFELELAAGIKVSQISTLANDMARALGAQAVRVVAPLPGKHTIGIEVPNTQKETVRIKDLIQRAGVSPDKMHIPLFLGKDSSGEALVSDLAAMPHLLIAGTTGSGKSVCINSIITSILLTKRPDEVKLILIDPKMVEMTAFNNIPHLMCPIVTETKRAEQILEWATTKMDERYAILAEAGVKNIASYNALGAEEIIRRFNPSSPEEEAKIAKKLPYVVIIIDELADLMMTAAKEIEAFIVRLAQKSRAIGIHMVVATQRPQATVVTGLIKSNLPTRISFRVAARMDSRIILDQNGAETLLGQGDMLFLKPGTSDLVRAQGAFVDDREVKSMVEHLKNVAEPQFHPELMQLNTVDASEIGKDEMFDEAVRIILETKRGSVSLLQRKLGIGYARASRIIEMMAAAGILGEYKGSQAREVMMTLEEYEQLRKQMEADEASGYEAVESGDSGAEGLNDEEADQPEDTYIVANEQID